MTSGTTELLMILPSFSFFLFFFPFLSSLKIAGDLLDLVGDSAFETVQDLIAVRDVYLIM